MAALQVIPVTEWGQNLAASERLELRDVQRVVEMPVAEDDASDLAEVFSQLLERFFDPAHPADHASINQVNPIIHTNQMVLNEEATKLDDFAHETTLHFFYEKPTMDAS